jgi:hypothetical protein
MPARCFSLSQDPEVPAVPICIEGREAIGRRMRLSTDHWLAPVCSQPGVAMATFLFAPCAAKVPHG